MTDIKIYDDCISEDTQTKIENLLSNNYFPWYLSQVPHHYTVDLTHAGVLADSNLIIKEYILLVHDFLSQGVIHSPFFEPVHEMMQEFHKNTGVEINGYHRIKANLQTQCNFSQEKFCNTPHVDTTLIDHMTAIYYVNDSDGDTIILKSGEKNSEIIKTISPKKGRFLVFNGKYYHAGRHPINSEKRVVINFNFV
jgi:hypothetical protein